MFINHFMPLSGDPLFKPTVKKLVLYSLSLIIISVAWWLVGISLFFGNQFGVFSTRAFTKSLFLLPGIFLLLIPLARCFFWPTINNISKRNRRLLFLTSSAVALFVLILFPLAVPAFQQKHSLQIISEGMKNNVSQGGIIEIRKLSYLDGSPVPFENLELSGDWQIVGDSLISDGSAPPSIAKLDGNIPGGIVLNIRHNYDAGKVSVIWDDEHTNYDLFASQSITTNSVFQGDSRNISQLGRDFLVQLFYFIGLLSIFFIAGLAIDERWPNSRFVHVFLVLVYIVIFIFFVKGKLSYMEFSAIRVYRDTISYTKPASAPWNSSNLWMGIRPFTYPVILKLFGVNFSNYKNSGIISNVVQFQYWFSIISWTALALALSVKLRKLWLRPFVFAVIIFFSLNLEVGIWDSLLLSESVSFSLLALLLTAWILWDYPESKFQIKFLNFTKLVFIISITILYVFTRESNQYFVIFGAAIYPFATLIGKAPKGRRKLFLTYLMVLILIVVIKNISFNVSNDWKIHIYDHLVLRILPDSEARDFFESAGLPVDQNLMNITNMAGFEYQDYLANDADMIAVSEWIDQSGVTTYMKYLLSRPVSSLMEPLKHLTTLFGGNNLEYHSPLYGVSTIPGWLIDLTNKFYPRELFTIWGFLGLGVLGVIWYLATNIKQSAWLVVGILLISLYPLSFIVWHGNPMEVERHAAQVGVQFRLMTWMAVALLLDQAACGDFFSREIKARTKSL